MPSQGAILIYMDKILSKITNTNRFNSVLMIFTSVLIVSFHFFFIYFINSSYVTAFVGEKWVSVIFAIGAICNISVLLSAPKLLRKYGLIHMTFAIVGLEALSLILLAFPLHPIIAILAFFLHMAVSSVLMYCLDMLLEQYSTRDQMGSMRGMFLTMWNIPPVITPFIAGLILANDTSPFRAAGESILSQLYDIGYWKIYLIAAVFLIPFAIILKAYFSDFKDPEYPKMDVKETIQTFYQDKNIFDVFADRLLLNLYFAWSVVYIPIYLHNHIGFTWNQVGIILSTMLLPFALFQRMIGKLQDQKHQEKSLLIFGFLIISVATIIQPFITTPSMLAWIIILFVAHIGAAFVEVSSESYFYRHVSPTNSGFISLFRMTRTIPYLIIPLLVGLSLLLLPFNQMFLVLGFIMLLGVRYAFLIKED